MEQLKVLVVDDNELMRDCWQRFLKRIKDFIVQVQLADSGETAVEMVKENNFDLITMDYSMGGISGSQAIKLIREINSDVTILGVSNHAAVVIAEDMVHAGANGYLLKDFNTAEFLAAIKTVREGRIYYSPEIAEKMG